MAMKKSATASTSLDAAAAESRGDIELSPKTRKAFPR
jgi:hypothetical protein